MSDATPRPCGLPDTAPPCIGCACPARATWDAAVSRARARLALRVGNARAEIDEALDGIDRDEMDGGWWPTSTGVEAGAERLARVHAALASIFNEPTPPGADRSCEMCRWEQGFGAREPLEHTCGKSKPEPEPEPTECRRCGHASHRRGVCIEVWVEPDGWPMRCECVC